MMHMNDREIAQEPARERMDLKSEYRPIGIGAVAAALTIRGKTQQNQSQAAANLNDTGRSNGSLAA
jgi:hypothetical protein